MLSTVSLNLEDCGVLQECYCSLYNDLRARVFISYDLFMIIKKKNLSCVLGREPVFQAVDLGQ